MCPACISAVTWWIVGSATGGGVIAATAVAWRKKTNFGLSRASANKNEVAGEKIYLDDGFTYPATYSMVSGGDIPNSKSV